jgi:hypothetical protein
MSIVDDEARELAGAMPEGLVSVEDTPDALVLHREPEVVLADAIKAAKTLMRVMDSKKDKVIFNGERYLEADDWLVLGHFYGVTAKNLGDPEFVNLGGIVGFKATCVLVTRDGREVGRASAYCLTDEEKWSARPKYARQVQLKSGEWVDETGAPDKSLWAWETRDEWKTAKNPRGTRPVSRREQVGVEGVPLFQLASMAQTRANAKVHSSVLRFVPVLAGLKATPAEELPDAERVPQDTAQTAHIAPGAATGEAVEGEAQAASLGLTRPYRLITDADRSALGKDVYLITEVAPGFEPMVAMLTLHTGQKFPVSAQPVKAMAEDCCRRVVPVVVQLEDIPTGGSKVKKLKRQDFHTGPVDPNSIPF